MKNVYSAVKFVISQSNVFHVTTDYLLGLESALTLDISGLDDEDVQLLQHTINVLRNKNQR